ncbi:deubiquitinating protein VCPIP1-like [Haliotis rufescens]|uniref:deubiquitinating protein VCPIP1-like n=1 Tax=Haliotis rufescens TaxID=6454 RepID=UPI001EB036A8|nr:deubiquitinating protein VCPIP1-like [Haliotis rufescens]
MSRTKAKSADQYKVLTGTCPDEECQAKLYFPAFDKSIECTSCGQRHDKASLQNVEEVTNTNIALHNLLKNVLLGNVKPHKGPENIKVLGLSNYVCKLLSPILTNYGMDKQTGKAKLLQNEFDCAVLGDRAFLIDPEHLSVMGYGCDRSGSKLYLRETLNIVQEVNDNQEYLIPIHADGDGHCLVHAVSRALVGRELFWHPLRVNLQHNFQMNLSKYKNLFQDFIDKDEWSDIINECHPDFIPPDSEPLGLRNIHIFGLANVLKRPIILIDSIEGMQSSGDYCGVFLPVMVDPEDCKKDGVLNKPLCIAWSSSGRNHFIPLVGIRGKPVPRLPRYMIQRAWGIPDTYIDKYIEFDEQGMCRIGGDKSLQDRYIQKLVHAMEDVFQEKYGVHPSVVADVHQFLYKQSGIVGVKSDTVVLATQKAIQERRLYRCLMCDAITEYSIPTEWFQRGGSLYNLALQRYGELRHDAKYSFPMQGAVCSYDKNIDQLILDSQSSKLSKCAFCQGDRVRQVTGNSSILYQNGDRTLTPSTSTRCTCGFKHYWNGREYDNFPEILPVKLEWNDRTIKEEVAWFQYEQDPSLNSNVYKVAQDLVQKHFPGEFGSERLVQKVVDKLLRLTAIPESKKETCEGPNSPAPPTPADSVWSPDSPSKIIITGQQQKSIHKEELTKSETERNIRHRIETNAPKQQQKKSADPVAKKSGSPAQSPRKSTPEKKPPPKESTPPPTTLPTASSMSTSTTSTTQTPGKKIRLATSDGRQGMLHLDSDVTFAQLQKLISDVLDIPPQQQRLRLGFPPRELKAGTEPVSLQHGDKLSVEILHPVPSTSRLHRGDSREAISPTQKMAWNKFDENISAPSAEALLESLKNSQAATDNIDMSISSMALLAQLSGRDLWTYVSSQPHLFSVGGLFYKQVERDLGLAPGKHCTLPSLPGKVFRYNSEADRLELCLEPHGHFQVEPDIERKVKSAAPVAEDDKEVKFGSSGVISRGEKGHVAFSGHGHSLLASETDTRMPGDLPDSPRKIQARKLTNFCDPLQHIEAISEEPAEVSCDMPDGTAIGEGASQSEPAVRVDYQKIGPGFSVIDQSVSNTTNENVDVFRQLAQAIEQTVADCNDFDESSSEALSDAGAAHKEERMDRQDEKLRDEQVSGSVGDNKEEKMDTT